MVPLHARMKDDGITMIVRGQREEERYKGALHSGDRLDGFEFLYPIEQWSTDKVFDFIVSSGWEIPRYYLDGMPQSGDCLLCTAWLGDGRGAYLKTRHPQRFDEYRERLAIVAGAAQASVNNMIEEVEVCGG